MTCRAQDPGCSKVKVTLSYQSHNTLYLNGGRFCSVTLSFLEITWQKCQTHEDDVWQTGPRSIAWKSRSNLKVKVTNPYSALVVVSVTLSFLERFLNNLAEPCWNVKHMKMTCCSEDPGQLLEGQGHTYRSKSQSLIVHWWFCPLSNSVISWEILK
jgi:hypothetical protein